MGVYLPHLHCEQCVGQEGFPIIMMREERYAVGVADAYSRVTGGRRIGVCTIQGGVNPVGSRSPMAPLRKRTKTARLSSASPMPSHRQRRHPNFEIVQALNMSQVDWPDRAAAERA